MMKGYLKRGNDYLYRQQMFASSEEKKFRDTLETEMMCFSGCAISDIGCVRLTNEDNYVIGKYMNTDLKEHSETFVSFPKKFGEWSFAGVFDGMGGGEMGELAAHDAAEIFLKAFYGINKDMSETEVDFIIRKTFLQANNRIIDLQQKYRVFGTTGTIVGSNDLVFKIYHLGDSRAYLFRGNDLFQITKDQTLAQMKIDTGMYREDDSEITADRHKLTEYIGRDKTQKSIKPLESQWLPIQTDDQILLCSDGLYDMCTDEEIAEVLRKDINTETKCTMLINKAREHGGIDNITSVLILFGS